MINGDLQTFTISSSLDIKKILNRQWKILNDSPAKKGNLVSGNV